MKYFNKYLKYKKKYINLKSKYITEATNTQGIKTVIAELQDESINLNELDLITEIKGPSDMYYYNVPLENGKVKKILLFGESHEEIERCITENCIEFDELIKIITTKKKCIDFFLEQNPKDNEGWNILKGGMVKVTPENENKFMMIKLRNLSNELQKKNNVRVHKWDLRRTTTSSLSHDILTINDLCVYFLNNFNRNSYEFSIYNNNYKSNIKCLLNYLIIDYTPDFNIIIMINLFCLIYQRQYSNYFIMESYYKNLMSSYTYYFNELKKLLVSFENYFSFLVNLEILLKRIIIIDNDESIKESVKKIQKFEEEIKEFHSKKENSQTLLYHKGLYNELDILKEKIKKYFNELIKISEILPDKDLKNIVIEIICIVIKNNLSIDLYHKTILTEISFYKEINFMKFKLNKTYQKFLKFCELNPSIFRSGQNIREKIIEIMINNYFFKERFNDLQLDLLNGSIQQGLNSAITDCYCFYRMFNIFDISKKRGPELCRELETAERIIVYAGASHINLYKSILDNYKNIKPQIIVSQNKDIDLLYPSYLENKKNIEMSKKLIENLKFKISELKKYLEDDDADIYFLGKKIENDEFNIALGLKKNNVEISLKQNYSKLKELKKKTNELIKENKKLEFFENRIFNNQIVDIKNASINRIGSIKSLFENFL